MDKFFKTLVEEIKIFWKDLKDVWKKKTKKNLLSVQKRLKSTQKKTTALEFLIMRKSVLNV